MLKIVNKIFQIFIDFLVFIVTILILFSLYKLVSIKVLHKPYANTFGYSIFEIATGSMEPTLNVKDLIIVKITKDVSVNDIVTYIEEDNLITHRVISINGDNLTTQGDANNSIDNNIKKDAIIGKTVYVIKKGGLIREVFLTPRNIIIITITLLLISISTTSIKNKKDTKEVKNMSSKKEKTQKKKLSKKERQNKRDKNKSQTKEKTPDKVIEPKVNEEAPVIQEEDYSLSNTKSFQNLKEEIFKSINNQNKEK